MGWGIYLFSRGLGLRSACLEPLSLTQVLAAIQLDRIDYSAKRVHGGFAKPGRSIVWC